MEFHAGMYFNVEVICGLGAGILFSMPVLPALLRARERFLHGQEGSPRAQRLSTGVRRRRSGSLRGLAIGDDRDAGRLDV